MDDLLDSTVDQSSTAHVLATSELLRSAVRATYARLSPREHAILLAALGGAEDKEIAAALGCSISTIRTLWQRIYQKTGLISRRKLIANVWEEVVRSLTDVIFRTT